MLVKLAKDLAVGDKFPSPREEEGTVRVVCSYGQCVHDERPDSVHVRNGNEWFIALYHLEEIHTCNYDTCFMEHPEVPRMGALRGEGTVRHSRANYHAG